MEFVTQNGGKKVEIKEASFKNACNLKKAVMKCLLNTDALRGVNIENLQGVDASKIFDSLGQMLINMDTSEEFDKAIMACLTDCIYDGFFKINEQLFDDKPEAREDYYEIVSKCAEVNLRPFFKSLVSELKQRFQTLNQEENQE